MVALGNALQIIDEFNLEAAQYCLSVWLSLMMQIDHDTS